MDRLSVLDSPTADTESHLPDVELAARVAGALRASKYGPVRNVDVAVSAGIVVLRGRVPSYFLKQVAQITARAIPGVYELQNELDVVPAPVAKLALTAVKPES